MELAFRSPSVLSAEECCLIVESAKKLITEVTVKCDGTEEFSDLLSTFGCEMGTGTLKVPRHAVDRVLERIAQEVPQGDGVRVAEQPCMNWYDKRPPVGGGVSGQAGLVFHPTDGLRSCNTEDLARYSRMVDAFPEIQWFHPALIPQDAPVRIRELHAYATIILNNSRPRLTSVYSKAAVGYFYEISKVVYGTDEATRANAPFIHSLWISSPFSIGREVIEGAMEVRRVLKKPFSVVTMPVAGTSAPVTLAGCLVLATAEILLENVISLAVDNRLNGYFSGALSMDVRKGESCSGPEERLLKLGGADVARYLFRNDRYVFPSFVMNCSANIAGEQSMMEKTVGALFSLMCGARVMSAMGTLSLSDIICPVQFLLDYELLGFLKRMAAGIEVTQEKMALDEIVAVTPRGADFLASDHTLEHYRSEQWFPDLMDRSIAMAWMREPRTMIESARARAMELWDSADNRCPLSESQQAEIRRILREAGKGLA